MQAGYTVSSGILKGDNFIEVVNYQDSNIVYNLGWIYNDNATRFKDKNSIGIWKRKQLKK